MNKRLRIIIGICFLIGAMMFGIKEEYMYVAIFTLVGAIYIYKGVK